MLHTKKKKGLVSLSRHDRTLEERRLSFFWMILFIIHWLLIPVHPLLLCFKYTKSFSFYSFFLVDRWNWFIHHKSSNLICSEWLLHHWESFVLFLNKIGAWHPWSNSPLYPSTVIQHLQFYRIYFHPTILSRLLLLAVLSSYSAARWMSWSILVAGPRGLVLTVVVFSSTEHSLISRFPDIPNGYTKYHVPWPSFL